ncbi:hypothetical protein [Flaviaesturariibacter amylovorans]|uniref:Sel1 repeat family protein n=1 Tax=Flaviaesturariibacter amylovorans TaxID=1084520 RepID=A0ABP8GB12_9BACT
MLRSFLLIALAFCLFHLSARAQLSGKTYAETKREQANAQYNKNYIEGTKYNRNTPSRSSGKVDDEAARALAEKFRHNAGKGPAAAPKVEAPKPTAEQLELQKQEADRKQREDYQRAQAAYQRQQSKQEREAARKAARVEYFTEMKAIGLTEGEAWCFAINAIPTDADRDAEWNWNVRKKLSALKDAYTRFTAARATGTYVELAALAETFKIAGYSYLKAQQFLATRFPEKTAETERAQLVGLFYFYSGTFERHPIYTEAQYANRTPAQVAELEALFLELYTRHPEAALQSCATAEGMSPVHSLYSKAKEKGDRDAQLRLAELGFRIPERGYKWKDACREFPHHLTNLTGYLEGKPAAYWIEVGKAQGRDAATVIADRGDQLIEIEKAVVKGGKPQIDADIDEVFLERWMPSLQKLAAAGDPSGLNALGVLSFGGKIRRSGRKEAIAYWQQAAAAGYYPAHLNLLRYTAAGLKDAPDKTTVMQEFLAYTSQATPQQLYKIARALVDGSQGDQEQELKELGKVLGQGAAAKGVQEAKEYYKFK